LEDLYVFRVPVVQVKDEIVAEGEVGEAELRRIRGALKSDRPIDRSLQ
jgi:hypothetical protein